MTDSDHGATLLSDRELEVLQGIAAGLSNAAIGDTLGLSADGVKTHATRLFRRLGAQDRAQAVALGYDLGILRVSSGTRVAPPTVITPQRHCYVTPTGQRLAVLAVDDEDADLLARCLWPGKGPLPAQARRRVLEALGRVIAA